MQLKKKSWVLLIRFYGGWVEPSRLLQYFIQNLKIFFFIIIIKIIENNILNIKNNRKLNMFINMDNISQYNATLEQCEFPHNKSRYRYQDYVFLSISEI